MNPSRRLSPRLFFLAILIISFSLRWALVFKDGQLFNPDEYRYLYSRVVAREIQNGNFTGAMTEFMTRGGPHQGFRLVGVLPAMVEMELGQNLHIPGLFFSLFSSVNIAIIWFLALRLGADEKEALWAVILAATSSALFYYSSHLLPYDIAMTFGLLALYVGLRGDSGIWESILTGILGFLAFFIYNGCWALVAFAFAAHALLPAKSYNRLFIKAGFAGFGFLASLLLMIWIYGLFDIDLLTDLAGFSNTILNGNFSEGGILPFTYLWAAERSLFIVWFALICYSIAIYSTKLPQRLIVWAGGVLFIYAALAIPSVILEKFVVYARLVRQLVPFLVLACAYGLRMIEINKRWGQIASSVILIFIIAQASLNFRRSFVIIYPSVFAKLAQERYPDFQPPRNMTYFYTPNVIDVGPYKAYYIKYITPLPDKVQPIEGKILMSAENPLSSFPPFRYEEGYAPEERVFFPASFSMMMLVEINR